MVTRLVGGLTPGDGSDPRTFPAIWNVTAGTIESQGSAVLSQGSAISAIEADLLPTAVSSAVAGDSLVYNGADWVNGPRSGNAIINGDFGVWQRGTSFTSSVYTADRFTAVVNPAGSATITRETMTPGDINAVGFGDGQFFLRYASTASNIDPRIIQEIEDVRTFSGQQVTVSFWAKADVADALGSVTMAQRFGSGGSAQVTFGTTAVTSTSLTSNFVRLSFRANVPSVSGKTIGAGSSLRLQITFKVSTLLNIDLWGIQVEAGPVATPFRLAGGGRQGAELALCQRYYYRLSPATNSRLGAGYNTTTTAGNHIVSFPTTMRVSPTALEQSGTAADYTIQHANTSTNLSAVPTFVQGTTDSATVASTVASGLTAGQGSALRANNTNAFLGWSAEV